MGIVMATMRARMNIAIVAAFAAAVACSSSAAPAPSPSATPTTVRETRVTATMAPTATTLPAAPTPTATPAVTPTRVLGPTPTQAPSPTPEPRRLSMPAPPGRIAFVSPDNQIYTVAPDGSSLTRVSPVRRDPSPDVPVPSYTWPVWSPDSKNLLYSAILPTGGPNRVRFVLMNTQADGSTANYPTTIFESPPASALVGAGTPHYALWSPNGEQIAMIVGIGPGLSVVVADPAQGGGGREMVPGAPVYIAWSPDSARLLIHLQDQLLRFDFPFFGPPVPLKGGVLAYLTPSFAPDDARSAFLVQSGSERSLNVLDADGAEMIAITDIPAAAAFRWSPDGESLAVLKSSDRSPSLYDELSIVAANGSSERFIASGGFVALQWSPDGSKILLASLQTSDGPSLRWSIVDVESGDISRLADFAPTVELAFVHNYFDQFAASHRFWSPDSRWVVLTGALLDPGPAEADADRGQETIWIVDTNGEEYPFAVGDGYLAFWSPR